MTSVLTAVQQIPDDIWNKQHPAPTHTHTHTVVITIKHSAQCTQWEQCSDLDGYSN